MSHLPESVLKAFRRKLVALRLNALNEAREAETRRRLVPLAIEAGEPKDRAEYAETWREGEIDDAESAIDDATARAAEAALKRIDDGSYGICQDCGEPIPRARLLAIPTALRCSTCQRAYEQRPGR